MMKIGIVLLIGIILLIIGYFIASITQDPSSSIPIFWLGFLFVLRSKQLASPESYWTKGAMWGLFVNTLVFVVIIIFGNGANVLIYYLTIVYRPITYIARKFFLHQYIQAGGFSETTKLILIVTYNFLNVFTYLSIGAIIGKLFIKQKK